jgi:DNA-binding CsgD family transcriptional regulator/tetratricopeptide (TPR) repeat protein
MPRPLLDRSALLDRGAESDALGQLLANAVAGDGAVVVLEGPAGIGKTALVRRQTQRAREQGLRVLRATGSELETGFPFGVARQLLERTLDGLPERERALLLSGPAGLADQVLGSASQFSAQTADLQAAVHALFRLTINLTREQPLLISVDDAHWADLTSLQFLHYLARRLADTSIALLVATRPNDPVTGPPALNALLGMDEVDVLRPSPLSVGAMAELARRTLGAEPAPEFVESCAEATGGNAFLATELLRQLAEEGVTPSAAAAAKIDEMASDAVGDRVTGWLAALPEPGAAVARSLAVLGEAELPLLARHAGVEVDVARAVCRRLEQAALLDDSDELRFAHPLVARAVARTIPAGERSERHSEAARLLLEAGAPLDACAVHLLASRPAADEWVTSLLGRAAAAAITRGAPAEAIGYLKRALAEPPPSERRPALMLELGSAQVRMRHTLEAQETLRHGLALQPPAAIRSGLATTLSHAYYLAGEPDAALEILECEREIEGDEQRRLALDGNAISLGLLHPERCEGMRLRLHAYSERAESGGLREPSLDALAGAEHIFRAEPSAPGIALMRRAFEGGLHAFDEHTFAFGWAICALDAADLSGEALVHVDRALAEARPRGDATTSAYLLSYRIHFAMRVGRLAEAEADGRATCELLASADDDASFPLALLDVLIERDAAAEAWTLCQRQELKGSQQRSAMLDLVRARVAIAVGRRAEALALLLDAGAQLDALRFLHPQFAPWRALAAPIADELGDRELALRLDSELMKLSLRTGAPTAIAQALRIHGCLHSDIAALSRSAQAAAGTPDRLEYARSLTELGAAQAAGGDREQGRETLRWALASAHEAGASTLAARARAELIAAGGRPRRPALNGVAALTPSELEVARLGAEGLSNRDIADGLFVSLKMVEQHLARAYAKLEISGRSELAAALRG